MHGLNGSVAGSAVESSNLMRPAITAEGWLVKSRERGLRIPFVKSKWVRRFFCLRVVRAASAQEADTYFLDEYRSDSRRRLRKSYDLETCSQVDSYLQLTDSSCTSRGGRYQWIFSMYLTKKNDKMDEIYLVAESEQDMLRWVTAICKACRLEKQDSPESRLFESQVISPATRHLLSDASVLSSSVNAVSLSSNMSSRSIDSVGDTATDEMVPPSRDRFEIPSDDEDPMLEFVFPQVGIVDTEQRRHCRMLYPRSIKDPTACSSPNTAPELDWPSPDEFEGNKSSQNYVHINKFHGGRGRTNGRDRDGTVSDTNHTTPRQKRSVAMRGSELHQSPCFGESSASACSSLTSSRRSISGEDDTSSCKSSVGSQPRTALNNSTSTVPRAVGVGSSASSSFAASPVHMSRKGFGMGLNQPVPAPGPGRVVDENDSSGETIKILGVNQDRFATSRIPQGQRSQIAAPPRVDRTKKPSRLRPDSDDDRPIDIVSIDDGRVSYGNQGARSFDNHMHPRPSNLPILPKTTPRRGDGGPKSAGYLGSRGLEYFEPVGTRSPSERTVSTLDNPGDYIRIDAQRTQAVKHLRAQRQTFD